MHKPDSPLDDALKLSLAAALALCLSAGCSQTRPFADVRLQTLAGGGKQPLESCPTPKCLTVYVAPWCPYCRAATPMILALREYLKPRGVTTRVVVGKDAPEPVRDYAAAFGQDTFLDPDGRISVGGVPAFMISDASGRMLSSKSGVPRNSGDSWDESSLAQVARMYGLP